MINRQVWQNLLRKGCFANNDDDKSLLFRDWFPPSAAKHRERDCSFADEQSQFLLACAIAIPNLKIQPTCNEHGLILIGK
jgi:hypothetical protein